MANRDALRELQLRLASRLQGISEQGAAASWLAVSVAQQGFLFPLAQAGEIFPMQALQRIPHVKPWFLGVANLRGGLYGVIDWASFAGVSQQATVPQSDASLIVLNPVFEVNSALRVDSLAGLRQPNAFVATEDVVLHDRPYIRSVRTDQQGKSWQEVDLSVLVQHPEFLSIRA